MKLVRSLLLILLGAGIALLGRQAHDIRQAHDAVLAQWRAVVDCDRQLTGPIGALLTLAKGRGRIDPDAIAELEQGLDDLRSGPAPDITRHPGRFELYDRRSGRLTASLNGVETSISAAGLSSSDPNLIPLRSRLEGTESAAKLARARYNAVALDYERLVAGGINNAIAKAMSLPVRLGVFETFGEPGSRRQEPDDDDD